ncbi:hypothetical protein Pint_21846 [Pistacia integerrima]|uniref:Uncharacterized protein n=1 Tax=Pistacia integerrima TaxID=434235 RepID=A0ACC0XB63_9ROSI|nr:hypothetical protein Pint_21846 [Pistacia integerrima]
MKSVAFRLIRGSATKEPLSSSLGHTLLPLPVLSSRADSPEDLLGFLGLNMLNREKPFFCSLPPHYHNMNRC